MDHPEIAKRHVTTLVGNPDDYEFAYFNNQAGLWFPTHGPVLWQEVQVPVARIVEKHSLGTWE